MTSKQKLASDATVKAQLAALTLEREKLTKDNEQLTAENTLLRKQNVELASVIENDLKAESKLRIMAVSNYKEDDLKTLSVEDLQRIEETLGKTKGDVLLPYKTIRASGASQSTNLTVGDLFNKSRKDILESGGTF